MTITKIHGFDRSAQDFSSQQTQLRISETVIVEADSPDLTLAQVVDALPNTTSGPGSSAGNPQRLTFTLYHSRHPYSDNYYLDSLESMNRGDKQDRFWYLRMSYATPAPSVIEAAAGGAKSQKSKKPDAKKKDQKPIIDPMDRPPVFKGSVKTVMAQRYHDLQNRPILHTNGLPLSKPIPFPVDASTWQWSFNIDVKLFANLMTHARAIVGSCNKTDINVLHANKTLTTIAAKTLKCTGFTYEEVWETPTAKLEYHYIRCSATFTHTEGIFWDTPPLSLHTKEFNAAGTALEPIEINVKGHKAKEPWPLQTTGYAVPYDQLDGWDPNDFGVLQAGGADLEMVPRKEHNAFFTSYNLYFPRVDD